MQIHLWAELKSPILFGAGLGEIKKDSAGQHCPNLIFLLHTNYLQIYNSQYKDKETYPNQQGIE